MREGFEESGVVVDPASAVGERIHPCELVSGEPGVAAPAEVAEVAWSSLDELAHYVPAGLFQPVRDYLNMVLPVAGTNLAERRESGSDG